MAQKKESRLQRKIRKALQKEFPGTKWIKIHGSIFQSAGEPDLLGCVLGLYFGLEVKIGDGKTSKIQKEKMRQIRRNGGCGVVVRSPEEAIRKVYRHLRKYYGKNVKKYFRSLSKSRGKKGVQGEKVRVIHATWDWQNHHSIVSRGKGLEAAKH